MFWFSFPVVRVKNPSPSASGNPISQPNILGDKNQPATPFRDLLGFFLKTCSLRTETTQIVARKMYDAIHCKVFVDILCPRKM